MTPTGGHREDPVVSLLHRLTGGLNNAGLSLEVLAASLTAGQAPSPEHPAFAAGARGVEQAAEAVAALRQLLRADEAEPTGGNPRLRADVERILHALARHHQVVLVNEIATEHADKLSIEQWTDALLDGIVVIRAAPAGRSVHIRWDAGEPKQRVKFA